MYGQKISFAGTKLWGENGREFIPLSNTFVEPIEVRSSSDDILVFYKDNDFSDFAESNVKAMRVNSEGEYVWFVESMTLSEVQSDKLHFSAGEFNNNQWIITWDDNRNGNLDIYRQNILLNGSLGPVSYEENFIIDPDSVYLPPAWDVTSVYFLNNGFVPIEILNFTSYNYLNGWEWYITNENVEFPFTIEPGEYFEMLVHIVLYTGGSEKLGWECDWILVETETNNYEIELCVDDSYLSTNSDNINSKFVRCFPVPATNFVSFESEIIDHVTLDIVIINSAGKQIKSFTMENNKAFVWDLNDDNNQKVPAGTYFYRLISDKHQETGKIILIE